MKHKHLLSGTPYFSLTSIYKELPNLFFPLFSPAISKILLPSHFHIHHSSPLLTQVRILTLGFQTWQPFLLPNPFVKTPTRYSLDTSDVSIWVPLQSPQWVLVAYTVKHQFWRPAFHILCNQIAWLLIISPSLHHPQDILACSLLESPLLLVLRSHKILPVFQDPRRAPWPPWQVTACSTKEASVTS